ncbi:MAG TPA: response regulator transcription factor [Phycisphaerales bacterium]|nr:response regulator transcription factor [Phycisphaerales bacterium]
MRADILVVDDEQDLLDLLRMGLEGEGYRVRTVLTGAEALDEVRTRPPDLVLLDIMLDDVSGIDVAAQLKHGPQTAGIPIILLTAKDSDTDIVVGLRVGADDYVTKPFSTAVLVARIEAVLRRVREAARQAGPVISAGPVRVIRQSRQVLVGDREIHLTGAEFRILTTLIEAGGKVLGRSDLKAALGSEATGQNERIVDVHVAALRKKLGADGRRVVRTVHGAGYRIQPG